MSKQGFAARLRWWRGRRGLSQLDLANAAGVSQRHLSFLELGRAAPSREMVLRLAATLAVPFREQNALLLAAGFAPSWREGRLDAPDMAMIDRALGFILAQQEPYPCFVIDRSWQLLRANAAGLRLVRFLLDAPDFVLDPQQPVNLADAMLSPDALRPMIENWHDVALYFIRSLRAEAFAVGGDAAAMLLDQVYRYPGIAELARSMLVEHRQDPILTLDLVKDRVALRLFTTLAVFATPLEVTAEEVRVESFFPADDATATLFRSRAKE